MDPLITVVRLYLRRAWRGFLGFLERYRLDSLPPLVPAILAVVVGLAIPFAAEVDTRPTALTTSLAVQRLEEFLASAPASRATLSPQGGIVTVRPAFHWEAVDGAAGYRFRLFVGDLLVVGTDCVDPPFYLHPGPGNLEAGRGYRFKVMARDESGLGMGGWEEAEFSVEEPVGRLRDLIARARARLEPDERALVMAGYYAWKNMRHELLSELERYRSVAPSGPRIALVTEVLTHLGYR